MPKYAKLPDASDDFGHEETDRILGRMEKKISKEYKQAEKELTEKLEKYLERFEAKDKVKRQQLAEGVITQDEYNRWRIGQVATGERWKAMRDTIAEEITKANEIAKSTINSHAEEVYSLNHNYAVYQAEKDAMIDTSYTLYNRRATEELFKNKKSLLPAPKEGSKAWQAAHDKDLRWNQQKINSSLIQGLLQGDSIPQIAKRLKDVVGMNKVSAVRNARTMTTGVENRARDDAVNDLRKKGIELDSVWIATLDNRTRHSHRLLHGEIKDLKTGKYSNGCRYPADPQGKPEEVYNCRCSQRSNVRGFPIDIPKWSPKMGDMTFEEWQNAKGGVEKLKWKDKLVQKQTTVKQEKTVNKPLQFKDGEAANEYFGKRPPRELRRENREEYDKRREEFEHSMYKTWYDSLSDQENQSIRNYTGDEYSGINGLLRNHMTKKMVDSWNQYAQEGYTVQEMINNIESGIDKFTLNDPIKVFRTCDPNILDSFTFKKGTIFKDNAFVSTTTITDKVASGNVVMEIEVPSGKGIGAWINPMSGKVDEEYEFLINRGAMFEVGEVYQRGDDTVIEMKWIGRDPEEWKYASREDVIERMKKEGIYDKSIAEKI